MHYFKYGRRAWQKDSKLLKSASHLEGHEIDLKEFLMVMTEKYRKVIDT